jgi:NADH:ubiquinone oxidoreductase subunit 4 (subunit M)
VWFAGTIERYEHAFYACLLFISGGAIGAFAQSIYSSFTRSRTRAHSHIPVIGIWGSGNRVAAAWKITIYLAIGSFHSAARSDPALPELSARLAEF